MYLKQGHLHGNPYAGGWAGAVMSWAGAVSLAGALMIWAGTVKADRLTATVSYNSPFIRPCF